MKPPSQLMPCLILFCVLGQVLNCQGQDIDFGNVLVKLNLFSSGTATGQRASSDIVPLNDGTGRLAVSNLLGFVRLVGSDGTALDSPSDPYLDTTSADSLFHDSFGLTGIAIHPDFADSASPGFGKLYSIGTENFATSVADFPTPAAPQLNDGAHQDVIYEWTTAAPESNTPNWSRREVARFDQPHREHNIADLAFDADGFLYFGSGDGGFVGTNVERALRSQQLDNHHGTVVRIDPLSPTVTDKTNVTASTNGNYSVPDANPFASDGDSSTLAEIFAYGFRSPYRLNFDRQTGDLYLGDVGESKREEVSLVELGKNYGWGYREGTLTSFAGDPPDGVELENPLFEYGRADGRTVVGGFVYRGTELPELQGKYIWADFGFQTNSFHTPTRLFYGDLETQEMWEINIDPAGVKLANLVGLADGDTLHHVYTIGEDSDGELYLTANPGEKIFRLVAPSSSADFDEDGDVDGSDLLTFQRGFKTGSSLNEGDATGDGTVTADDLGVWKIQFGQPVAMLLNSSRISVPEPNACSIAIIFAIGYLAQPRSRKI